MTVRYEGASLPAQSVPVLPPDVGSPSDWPTSALASMLGARVYALGFRSKVRNKAIASQ